MENMKISMLCNQIIFQISKNNNTLHLITCKFTETTDCYNTVYIIVSTLNILKLRSKTFFFFFKNFKDINLRLFNDTIFQRKDNFQNSHKKFFL